ncbi:MAG: hypothetical protein WBM90_04455 [Acidimicrobiia bacterium]
MSDLLESAAAALGTPASLVERSAAARAAETGSTVDEILSAWAGGAPVVSTSTPEPTAAVEVEPIEVVEDDKPVAVAVMEPPLDAVEVEQTLSPVPEPEIPLEPAAFGHRLKTATRIGAWAGAALGLIAFFIASAFWADTAAVVPDSGPIVQVSSQGVVIGVALVSVLFGAIVAGFSRAGASWANPSMQLSNSKASTVWIGILLGLVLGVVAGVVLTSAVGTPIEGSDGLVQLPILPTLTIMIAGGAVLGALTAALPQLIGTPVAVGADAEGEVTAMRGRLRNAIGVPMAALLLLVLLVLPFGYTLIRSNELAGGGAAIVAILTAGGILGFAALAGSKPQMKITLGDFVWAAVGLGAVLLIILAVLFYTGESGHEGEASPEEGTAVVLTI